jgi:PAS domain S-box-containing protein
MKSSSDRQGIMKLHPLTLKFAGDSSPLETLFQKDHFRASLPHNRAAMIVGALFYSGFGVLDHLLMPENKGMTWLIRFAVIDPLIIAAFLLSFTRSFERYGNRLITAVAILAGAGIIWMIVIAPPPVGYSYYAGLLLLFMWVYAFVRIPFLMATLTGWVVVALYEIAAVWTVQTPMVVLVSNNFFFISANIIGMIACYSLEYQARRNFFLARQVEKEREQVHRINEELENQTIEYQSVNRTLEREVSERRKAEEELRESQEVYTKLVDSVPDVIVRTDLDGNILFVNDNTLKISGYSRGDIEGRNMLVFVTPEDRERLRQNAKLMQERRLGPREYQLIMKSGEKVPFELNGEVLRDRDGAPFELAFVCRDLSDRRQAEEEKQYREKLQGVLEMAGAVCHEMNQPMQVISGLSELLLMNAPEDEPQRGKLKTIFEQVQRMHKITGRLMAIRKYRTKDYAGFARIVDIHESHDDASTDAERANGGIEKEKDPARGRRGGDSESLERGPGIGGL